MVKKGGDTGYLLSDSWKLDRDAIAHRMAKGWSKSDGTNRQCGNLCLSLLKLKCTQSSKSVEMFQHYRSKAQVSCDFHTRPSVVGVH